MYVCMYVCMYQGRVGSVRFKVRSHRIAPRSGCKHDDGDDDDGVDDGDDDDVALPPPFFFACTIGRTMVGCF